MTSMSNFFLTSFGNKVLKTLKLPPSVQMKIKGSFPYWKYCLVRKKRKKINELILKKCQKIIRDSLKHREKSVWFDEVNVWDVLDEEQTFGVTLQK